MDAKPFRGLKISDENAMPTAQTKSLHHRNKSSPALSTLASKGAFKMGFGKKAALGDISQTARGNRTVMGIPVGGKENKPQQEMKVAALAQPAQKPLSLAVFNDLVAAQPPPTELPPNSAVKKILAKRATMIFKDYSTVPRSILSEEVQPYKSDKFVKHVSVQLIESFPQSHNVILEEPVDLRIPTISTEHEIQLPVREQKHQLVTALEDTAVQTEVLPPVDTKAAEEKILSILHNTDNQSQQPIEDLAVKASTGLDPIHNPNYIEEEYDDNYEDDGYVTARSFRSKPDNVTEGNMTTVLAPKVNDLAKRELDAAAAVVSMLKEPADVDDEEWDISMVSEYKEEIFQYYRELETRFTPNPHYMDVQTEIQWSMRSVLIDWVVQVHDRFQLLPETLFLTVNIIDRFLSIKVVSINKLQLVGATALFVAAKYEEVNCPNLKEMVFMVDKTYDEDEIIKAERFMLTLLGFDLGWPGPMSFLRRISTADDYDLETRTVAKYFLELTIMDERFVASPPSYISAGAHCLARLMLNKGHWSAAHVHYSGYTYQQLQPILINLLECLDDPIRHHNAIYEKYCDRRFKSAANFAQEEIHRGFRLLNDETNSLMNFHQLCQSRTIFEYVMREVPGYSGFPTHQF